jgi:hypothetical protein
MRKPINICASRSGEFYALCDDGSIWAVGNRAGQVEWFRLPDVPQDPPRPVPAAAVITQEWPAHGDGRDVTVEIPEGSPPSPTGSVRWRGGN